MKSILQIHNVSKNEFKTIIEDIIDNRFNDFSKSKESETLTVQQTSKFLGVSTLTVHNYIRKGFIPASKIGRRIVIQREDLNNALSNVKSMKYKR